MEERFTLFMDKLLSNLSIDFGTHGLRGVTEVTYEVRPRYMRTGKFLLIMRYVDHN